MGRRGREFVSNRYRALESVLAASRRIAPRPGGLLGSVDGAVAGFEGL